MSGTWERRLGLALDAAIAIVLAMAWLPLNPPMMGTGVGVDQTWIYALNEALTRGYAFGRDVVFGYGPLVSLVRLVYHPGTYGLVLLFSAWFLAAFLAAYALGPRRWSLPNKALLLLAIVLAAGQRDVLMTLYALMVGDVALGLAEGGRPGIREATVLGLLFSAFVPISLAKDTIAINCACAWVAAVGLMAARGLRPRLLAALCTSSALFVALDFAIMSQPLSAILDYARTAIPVALDYTENNSRAIGDGFVPLPAVAAYMAGSIAFLALIAKGANPRHRRPYLLALYAPALFLAYKHLIVSFFVSTTVKSLLTLGLAGMLLLPRLSPRPGRALTWAGLAIVAALLATFPRLPAIFGMDYFRPEGQLRMNLSSLVTLNFPSRTELDAAFEAGLATIREYASVPPLEGTVTPFGARNDEILATGANWRPLPSLECGIAYSPFLAEADRAFLTSGSRPDIIAFSLHEGFGVLPSLPDGASYVALLSGYEPFAYLRDTLYLRHRGGGVRNEARHLGTVETTGRLGELLTIPAKGEAVLARLRFRKTPAGLVASFLFKPSRLEVRLSLQDGSSRTYLLVSTMTGTGFVISPLIEDAADFGYLFAGPELNPGKRVLSVEIYPKDCPWEWESSFDVELTPVEYRTDPQVKNLLDLRFRVNGL